MKRRLLIFIVQGAIIFLVTTVLQQLSANGLALTRWHITNDQLFVSTFAAILIGLLAQSNWGQHAFRRQRL